MLPQGLYPIYVLDDPDHPCGFVFSEVSNPYVSPFATVADCNFMDVALSNFQPDYSCVANYSSFEEELIITCWDGDACTVVMTETSCDRNQGPLRE